MREYLSFAKKIALKAGRTALSKHYCKLTSVTLKQDTSPVTAADHESNRIILSAIKAKFPSHNIVSEESPVLNNDSEYTWYIDPIDGTSNFVHSIPAWCVSIGLYKNYKPFIGVIYDPIHNHLYSAQKGKGAYLNGKRINASGSVSFKGMPIDIAGIRSPAARARRIRYFSKLMRGEFLDRAAGSSALALARLAAGNIGALILIENKPWDIAAGGLIVLEAGGSLSVLRVGKRFLGGDYLFSSNKTVEKHILKLIK